MIERAELHAFADKELDPQDMARIADAVKASPEAQRELEAIQSLKSCLQTKIEQPECRDAWKECLTRFNEMDRVKVTENFVGKYAWALCIVLFFALVGGGVLNRARGGSVGLGEVASITSELVPMGGGSQMRRPEQLRNWINDQTGCETKSVFDPSRIESVAYSDQANGRNVMLRLRDQAGTIDVLYLPNVNINEGMALGGSMYAGKVNGLNCVTWHDGSVQLLVIGNRQTDELRTFAQSMYR